MAQWAKPLGKYTLSLDGCRLMVPGFASLGLEKFVTLYREIGVHAIRPTFH